MIAIEQSRWKETIHGFRSVSTVMPPMTACAGMPSAITSASRRRSRRPDCQAATNVPIATATSTQVSIRLPNSIAEWTSYAPCGVSDSSVHRGHVGQPRPEPVSRTTPPVTTMPMLTTIDAHAQPRSQSSRCRTRWPRRSITPT